MSHKPISPKTVITALLTALCAAITLFLRIPIPKSGGYLNIGDVVLMFAALYWGPSTGFWVGGVGSAIADLLGFPIFAPFTLVIKGIEGMVSGMNHVRYFRRIPFLLGPVLGMVVMVGGYFVTESFVLSGKVGMAAALAELPFNAVQGVIGVIGGSLLFVVIRRWTEADKQSEKEKNGSGQA